MFAKLTIALFFVAGTVLCVAAFRHFCLYLQSGLIQEAIAANSYMLKAGLPAVLGLLVAVKSRRHLDRAFIALALLPTVQLLLLSLALFFRRWA